MIFNLWASCTLFSWVAVSKVSASDESPFSEQNMLSNNFWSGVGGGVCFFGK